MTHRRLMPFFTLGCCLALSLTGCFNIKQGTTEQGTQIYSVSGSADCTAKTTCQVTVSNSTTSKKTVAWSVAALSLPGATAKPVSGIVAPGQTATVTVTAKTSLCDSTITFAYHATDSDQMYGNEPPFKMTC